MICNRIALYETEHYCFNVMFVIKWKGYISDVSDVSDVSNVSDV